MLRTDVRLLKVARQGIEPRLTDSKSVVHPSHSQAQSNFGFSILDFRFQIRGTIEIRTRSACVADMPRAIRTGARLCCFKSSPGRTRTVDRLFVRQVPSPLGHRTVNFGFGLVILDSCKRKTRDSNPEARFNASCFQNSVLIQPDVFLFVPSTF